MCLMTKKYSICGKVISFDTPPISTDLGDMNLFEYEGSETDITVTCHIAENLPDFPEIRKDLGNGVFVSWQGKDIYRYTPMGVYEGSLSRSNFSESSFSDVYFTNRSFKTFFHYRYLWNSVSLSQLLLPFKILLLHASYISYNGKAILFSAPCGTGKSTQAELWRRHKGAEVINGDKAGVSVESNGAIAHGLPFSGTSGICKNRSMPLGAIVLLGQAPENKIRRLNGAEALTGIMKNVYLDFAAPEETERCVDTIIELLKSVPVYKLDCTPDSGAVETLYKELGIRSEE